MSVRAKFRLGLAAKLAVCVIASTAAFFTLFGFLNLRMERRQSEELVKQSAERVSEIILRSTRYEMLHNNREALEHTIQEIGSQPGIQRIRISSPDGLVTLASHAQELGKVLEKAEARPGARIFTDARGNRVMAVVRQIENSASCSEAACHVHPPGQKVLGVVDTDLSLAMVDTQLASHQATLKWFLAGAVLFGCAAAALFMWVAVYRPVKELIDGTHRVREGDLTYRLPVRSDDELGDLAASFNQMTEEVAGVQAHIEAQVRRKTAELERVHRTLLVSEKMASMGKLAATVAHEINNPLFGILTYARLVSRELLKHDVPGREEMAEQLQTIERESKRCGDLVKNLLAFSRQAPSHREPNDLNTVVHRAVMLVRHKLEMQDIELVETLGTDLPAVECDGNQIQQVVLVLLVNASEAMPKGGLLNISTGFEPVAGVTVLRVKDSGTGIPAEVVSKIFDPFFTTKEDQNRTGLGLAVAHSIVEQHAGEISVHSTPGEGTEFTITLPVTAADTPRGEQALTGAAVSGGRAMGQGPGRI